MNEKFSLKSAAKKDNRMAQEGERHFCLMGEKGRRNLFWSQHLDCCDVPADGQAAAECAF